jgi:hypothetical protein
MTLHELIRTSHRWLGMVFTLTVVANFAAMSQGEPPPWLVYSPLAPLALLMISGLYMFFRPYFARRRAARATT